MALNGIDISGWQRGINLEKVPCDFVIAKATQGVTFKNDDLHRSVEQALRAGKAVGTYHYISGGGVDAEARNYVNACRQWQGKIVWCLDWESHQNSEWGNLKYLDALVKKVSEHIGRPPMIYASLAVFPWDIAKKYNCGTWVAQYANKNRTGYQKTPWNEGKYGCAIRQYSSTGKLPGYEGNLDLNKFYGDRVTWDKYAGAIPVDKTPKPEEKIWYCRCVDPNHYKNHPEDHHTL